MRHKSVTTVVLFALSLLGQSFAAEETTHSRTAVLEGDLKAHPKFLYHYYLVLGPNQTCALYGLDHKRKPDVLSQFKLGDRIRVEGVLGTHHHPGGTEKNPSPFPKTWVIYMDVHKATPVEDAPSER